ncbi:hypothetical protein EDB19DRAFT_2028655 [Suillus lakei]|nr:hypothetical protein EDB19DRAFT_2028655 [Suillus lakei]
MVDECRARVGNVYFLDPELQRHYDLDVAFVSWLLTFVVHNALYRHLWPNRHVPPSTYPAPGLASQESPIDAADREMLVENVYISNDPAQRIWIQNKRCFTRANFYMASVREGDVMPTNTIARVLATKVNTSYGFKVDDLKLGGDDTQWAKRIP